MMRKKIINRSSKEPVSTDHTWLDLERLAQVEITSEETGHPVESALSAGGGPGSGWPVKPGNKRFACSLMNRRHSDTFILYLRKRDLSGPMSLCCDGRKTVGDPIGKSFASNTPSARRARPGRSKTTPSTSTG
jgi:hypothetical protein